MKLGECEDLGLTPAAIHHHFVRLAPLINLNIIWKMEELLSHWWIDRKSDCEYEVEAQLIHSEVEIFDEVWNRGKSCNEN